MDVPLLILVYTPVGSLEAAKKLAHGAVSLKLAVCANIFPQGHSIYIWEGEVESSDECYVLFKTSVERTAALQKFIENNHPYVIPAIIFVDSQANYGFYNHMCAALALPPE